jgi:predicted dehydrogenase
MHNRRSFIKNISAASAAVAISSSTFAKGLTPADEKVKIGVIGTGLRGQSHVDLLLRRKDTDIVAICDIDERMLTSTKGLFTKAGKALPKIYTGDRHAYRLLLEHKNLDAIVIATP